MSRLPSKTRFPAICLAFVLSTVALAPQTARREGVYLVPHQLPELWHAAVESLTQPGANDMFRSWTDREVAYLNRKIAFLYGETRDKPGPVLHHEEIFDKYWTTVFGVFGELHGNIMMRERLRYRPGSRYLDELEYRALNADGKAPDGILYLERRGELHILDVMESKMGNATYDREQARGYLRRWQRKGIAVTGTDYDPGRIRLRVPTRGNPLRFIPLEGAGLSDLERITVFVATSEPPDESPLLHEPTPFTAGECRDVIFRFIQRLVRGKPIEERSALRVERPAAMPPAVLEDYRQQLDDWVLDHGRFPRSSDEGLGRLLAKRISQRGSQSRAFLRDLSEEARLVLAMRGGVPAKAPLGRALLAESPLDEARAVRNEVASGYRAYVMAYGDDLAPLLLSGASTDPRGWEVFLRTLPDPYDPALTAPELEGCALAVAAARARRAQAPDPVERRSEDGETP